MEYTICIINDKRVVKRAKGYNFATIEEAHRFAEGITCGLWVSNKCWSVVLVKDDTLDFRTAITKNLTSKRQVLLIEEYGML